MRYISLMLLSMAMILSCKSSYIFVKPVCDFKIDKYLGLWYEIARVDNRFERGLTNVTIFYHLENDTTIDVVNKGFNAVEQEKYEAHGKAIFAKNKHIGHLKITFWGPWYADYVVFYIDDDYKYAFVAGDSKNYLWLLARSPVIDKSIVKKFKEMSENLGFNPQEIIMVDQSTNFNTASKQDTLNTSLQLK